MERVSAGDTIEVRARGCHPHFNLWDALLQWCGMENVFIGMATAPEFMHTLAHRLTEAQLCGLGQLEKLGVLGGGDCFVHCTGAYTDELSSVSGKSNAKDMWTFSLSQIISSVSKEMHREFEAAYSSKWFERFGLGYYGCCEPLHDRVDIIRIIPNVRKISMSPWADYAAGAEAIGGDYVLSCKPHPGIFVQGMFDANTVRKDLERLVKTCEKTGTALEIIMKDISTVDYQPQHLWEWSRIACEVTGGEMIS